MSQDSVYSAATTSVESAESVGSVGSVGSVDKRLTDHVTLLSTSVIYQIRIKISI
jgi:hypothetical protein